MRFFWFIPLLSSMLFAQQGIQDSVIDDCPCFNISTSPAPPNASRRAAAEYNYSFSICERWKQLNPGKFTKIVSVIDSIKKHDALIFAIEQAYADSIHVFEKIQNQIYLDSVFALEEFQKQAFFDSVRTLCRKKVETRGKVTFIAVIGSIAVGAIIGVLLVQDAMSIE